MNLEIYPQDYSKHKPFFVEFRTENNKESFCFFRANFVENFRDSFNPEGEMHPWNMGLEGELVSVGVTFWRKDFVKYFVDCLNACYCRENFGI